MASIAACFIGTCLIASGSFLGASDCIRENSPTTMRSPEAALPAPANRETLRTVTTVPDPDCSVEAVRSLDSKCVAVLLHYVAGEKRINGDKMPVECLVIVQSERKAHILQREREGRFADWQIQLCTWEPGGKSLLVGAAAKGRIAWFRVDAENESQFFKLDTPVIGGDEKDDDPIWPMMPRFNIYGAMIPVPMKQSPNNDDFRETDESTRFDMPVINGLTFAEGKESASAFVDQKAGVLIIASGTSILFSERVRASVAGVNVFFDWNGRTLACRWTNREDGTVMLPNVPGSFRTVDLGPAKTEIRPIAALNSHATLLWIQDQHEGRLVVVDP